MSQNELITGWIYKKGELQHKRIIDMNLNIAVIAALILSGVLAFPIIDSNYYLLRGKIGGWMIIILFILLIIVLNFVFRMFSGGLFSIYKMICGIKEEEIIFTNHKISSTNKTWILNDELNTLTSVKLDTTGKIKELNFRGTEQKPGKTASTYTVDIPVPPDEISNAEKICKYFRTHGLQKMDSGIGE